MRSLRSHLFGLALATTCVQLALAAGVAAVCCATMSSVSSEVASTCVHDGEMGAACPMHHKKAPDESEDSCRIGCGQTILDPLILGAIGILPPAPAEGPFTNASGVPAGVDQGILDIIILLHTPPPRG